MVFSSILFMCVFLPITLIAYYLAPRPARNFVLLFASLLFYAWGEPKYVLVMIFSILAGYSFGRLLEQGDQRKRKAFLIGGIAVLLGILVFFKYTDFLIGNLNALTGAGIPLLSLALPIGISFYSFQILSYLVDVYRGDVAAQKNILDFGLYVTMFPQLIAGPIVRYVDVAKMLKNRRESALLFSSGVNRFLVGLGKKVLLANQIGALWNEVSTLPSGDLTTVSAWLGAVAFMLQIYFDFSGYSDMAIGLGRMFGFEFIENFDYPYQAQSVTQFWRKWHMSLSGWFRDYLYIPLGGNRKGPARQKLNLLIVWALTGLWHGASWNFVLWGLYFFLLLVLEKAFLLKWLDLVPKWIGHVYTLFSVLFGWMLFACEDASRLSVQLYTMLGITGNLAHSMDMYRLLSNLPLLIIGAICCTHVPKTLFEPIDRETWYMEAARALGSVAIIVLCVSLLAADSYNPFLYFRF